MKDVISCKIIQALQTRECCVGGRFGVVTAYLDWTLPKMSSEISGLSNAMHVMILDANETPVLFNIALLLVTLDPSFYHFSEPQKNTFYRSSRRSMPINV